MSGVPWNEQAYPRNDGGSGTTTVEVESFFFRLARALADVSGIPLPKDLKLAGHASSATPIRSDVTSHEGSAGRRASSRRPTAPSCLAVRLKTPLAAWQQRLDGLVVRLQAAASKLQA